ncbi:hypothetical protein [Flavobacterium sp.]|uniref:hypothetical protein n=1 Tax=Flavobacterium sp. TaxID=239 RepID=UPI003751AE5F
MNPKALFIALSLTFIFSSCTNDSTNDLIDATPVLGVVKYNQNVKSIIDANCISCHGAVPTNGAPMSLVTYNQVKNAMLNNGLLDRISRQNGEIGVMPLGAPRLPQNSIDIVSQWSTDGLQE